MWLANQTRPDILNAVRAVARYSKAPKLVHWKAALHILMYIRFTSSYGITFQRGTTSGVGLEGVCRFGFREQSHRQEICFWRCCNVCWCLRVVFLEDAEECDIVFDGGRICCDG